MLSKKLSILALITICACAPVMGMDQAKKHIARIKEFCLNRPKTSVALLLTTSAALGLLYNAYNTNNNSDATEIDTNKPDTSLQNLLIKLESSQLPWIDQIGIKFVADTLSLNDEEFIAKMKILDTTLDAVVHHQDVKKQKKLEIKNKGDALLEKIILLNPESPEKKDLTLLQKICAKTNIDSKSMNNLHNLLSLRIHKYSSNYTSFGITDTFPYLKGGITVEKLDKALQLITDITKLMEENK